MSASFGLALLALSAGCVLVDAASLARDVSLEPGDDRPTMAEHKASKQSEADSKAAAAADEGKSAAVNKVIEMLEELQAKVGAEGEKEVATYNKFACWCKDTTTEKTAAITTGEDEKSSLVADINDLSEKRDELDEKIAKAVKEVSKTEDAMTKAARTRSEELKSYEINAADLKNAGEALKGAIGVLKTSTKKPSAAFLQSVGETVRRAALLADALGLGGSAVQRTAELFLQDGQPANEVEMKNYNSKSGGIIETLEELLTDFTKEKNDLDAEEVKAAAAHDSFMQAKTSFLNGKMKEIDDDKKSKSKKQAQIAEGSKQLSTVSATLLDDKSFLMETSSMCSNKATTWDQRSALRAQELQALATAIEVVRNQVASRTSAGTVRLAQTGVSVHLADVVATDAESMEAIEAEAEDAEKAAPDFVQKSMRKLRGRHQDKDPAVAQDMIVKLLRSKGQALKSTLLTSLATQLAGDPLAKVKSLISELVERLLQEAANEATQKGWCDKAMGDAAQKRDYAAKEIEELNGVLAREESRYASMTSDLAKLAKEIAQLTKELKETDDERAAEKAENAATVEEAQLGAGAVQMAVDIISKFYKTAAKAKVEDEDLLQVRGPGSEAPDAGFDGGEAYTGSQSASTGILGMLDVMKSDFERTVSETEKAEEQARQDHLRFQSESEMSLAEKDSASKQTKSQQNDAEETVTQANEDLTSQVSLLQSSLTELLELKATCVDTGMSYEERVARREDEISSLKQALCIFQNFAEYGADANALNKACN